MIYTPTIPEWISLKVLSHVVDKLILFWAKEDHGKEKVKEKEN